MPEAKNGDAVRVNYIAKTLDGQLIESTYEKEPVQLIIGADTGSEALSSAFIGLKPGDKRTRIICEAFGKYRPEMVLEVDRKSFPEEMELKPGKFISINLQGNDASHVKIAEVGEDKVKLDMNHPLVGKDIIFEVELIEIL